MDVVPCPTGMMQKSDHLPVKADWQYLSIIMELLKTTIMLPGRTLMWWHHSNDSPAQLAAVKVQTLAGANYRGEVVQRQTCKANQTKLSCGIAASGGINA